MEPITGGCACRAIQYEVRAEPIRMLKCPVVIASGPAAQVSGRIRRVEWVET
jgi:hypothetical protein